MTNNRKISSVLVIFCIFLGLLMLQPAQLGLAQSPTTSPTPNSTFSSLDVIIPEFQAQPLPLETSNPVNITFSLRPMPSSECYGIPSRQLTTFIIIDTTADIRNFEGLKESAAEFISQADQDIYKDGNSFPSSFSVVSVQGILAPSQLLLTNSAEARKMLDGLSISETLVADLSAVIDDVRNMYKDTPQSDAQPVIALFISNAGLITQKSLEAVYSAKEAGFEVVLITRSDDTSQIISPEDGVRVSSSSLFFHNPSSSDLRRAFVELSDGDPDLLARDISVNAIIFPVDAFETLHIDTRSTVFGGAINWNENSMSNGQTLSLTYQARVNPNLNVSEVYINFALNYIDCNGLPNSAIRSFPLSVIQNIVPVSTETGSNSNEQNTIPDADVPYDRDGPSINPQGPPAITGINLMSLLPFLKWIGIALVVVGGLFLLWKILTREKTVNVPPQPPPLPTIETLDPIPDWFKELKDNNTSGYFDRKNPNIELQETILIGLGLVGRNVLERIIAGLNTHFGDSWRSKIRIIQVDVDLQIDRHSSEWQIPSGLRQGEWVLLKPELTEIQERLRKNPQDWEHLHWYEQTAPVYPRSKSRMALFYDLRDGPSSQLWNAVEAAYYDLDKPLVRVIGSTFDSVGSGLLADVAFLVKQGITRRNADVEMWLLGPSREEWSESPNPGRLSPSEQVMRTLAALRELERFQRNAYVTFQYVPPTSNFTQLNQTYDYAVIPTVFLFDPASKNLRFSEMMREMSHVLMSLLYEKTARSLSLHLSATRVQAVGKSVACGIGHVEVRLSSGLLEEAVAWRMVKDILFEEAMGLFPLERVNPNGEYQPLRDFSPTPSLNVLHEQETVKRWIIYAVKTGDQRRLFNNISARLGQILNGEPAVATSDFIQGRRMALDKAERWLRLLTNTLKMYPEIQIVQKINKLQDQLAVLQSWLVNDVSALALSCWNEARANLKKLRAASGFETDIPPDLEWSAYKEYIILNEAQISKYKDQSPLLKVASRFGWHVHFDENEEEWRLNLILPPTDFSWNEGSRPDAYAIPVSASEFLDSLFKLALPFAQMGMGHSAVERANTLDVSDWKDRVKPMLRFEELEASRLMGSLAHKHILGISEGLSPRESKELTEKVSSFIKPIDVVDTGDRSVAHFLNAVNWIPFETMDIYNNDQWTFNTVLPSYYVWPLEQWASSIETDSLHRLSVSFLTRFNRHEKFMKVFGLGLIYDLFTFEPKDGWTVPFSDNDWKRMMPYRNPQLAASLMDMFFTEREYEAQKDKCITIWNALIEERRSALKDSAYEFFRNFEQTKLKIYFQYDGDDAKAERDLGVFLSYLLQEEKQLRAR